MPDAEGWAAPGQRFQGLLGKDMDPATGLAWLVGLQNLRPFGLVLTSIVCSSRTVLMRSRVKSNSHAEGFVAGSWIFGVGSFTTSSLESHEQAEILELGSTVQIYLAQKGGPTTNGRTQRVSNGAFLRCW